MKFKHLAATVAAFLAVGSTSAAPQLLQNFGVHDSGELAGLTLDSASLGAFDFGLTFALPGTYVLTSVAVSNDFAPIFHIAGGTLELYASNGDADLTNDTLLGSTNYGPLASAHNWGTLNAGDYFYRIGGNVDGTKGGSFLLSSSISPVPEPATYALLLAGMGLVGVWTKRRRP